MSHNTVMDQRWIIYKISYHIDWLLHKNIIPTYSINLENFAINYNEPYHSNKFVLE